MSINIGSAFDLPDDNFSFTQRENTRNDYVSIPPLPLCRQSVPACLPRCEEEIYATRKRERVKGEKKGKEGETRRFFSCICTYELSKTLYNAMITFMFFPFIE